MLYQLFYHTFYRTFVPSAVPSRGWSNVLQVRLSSTAEQLNVAVLGTHNGEPFEIRADVAETNKLGEYQAVYTVQSIGTLRLLVKVTKAAMARVVKLKIIPGKASYQ